MRKHEVTNLWLWLLHYSDFPLSPIMIGHNRERVTFDEQRELNVYEISLLHKTMLQVRVK